MASDHTHLNGPSDVPLPEEEEIFSQCENCSSDITFDEYNRTATTEYCDVCGGPERCEICDIELLSVYEEMRGLCNECIEDDNL